MLSSKLLTVGGVVAVLLCGACGMVFKEPAPAPPRMQLFVRARTIRVEVSNTTTTHGIDPETLQAAIVAEIDKSRKRSPLTAVAQGNADCTLVLTVVSEEEYSPVANGADSEEGASWRPFRARIHTEVKGKDGRVLWSGPPLMARFRRNVIEAYPDRKPEIRPREFFTDVAAEIVYQVLSQ